MKHYSYFHAPVLAFFSRDFYRAVLEEKRGTGFLYLLSLLTVLWVLVAMHWSGQLGRMAEILGAIEQQEAGAVNPEVEALDDFAEKMYHIFKQFPTITVTEGVASTEVKEPFIIYDYPLETPIIVIDTKNPDMSIDKAKAPFLITANRIIGKMAKDEAPVTLLEFDEFKSQKQAVVIDRKVMLEALTHTKRTLFALLPVLVLMNFAFMVPLCLFYGWVSKTLYDQAGRTIDFTDAVRLATVANTVFLIPSTLLVVVPMLKPLNQVPFIGAILLLLPVGYMYVMLKRRKNG